MKVMEISCRTALSPSGLSEFDYTLNPYKNCSHACAYCYAPAIVRVERGKWGQWVGVKRNIPSVLARELKTKEPGRVGIALVTDPYQPAESGFKVTRYCLEQLLKADWPVTVLTKSSLAARDIDLLARFSDADLGVTITTVDEPVARALEPGASPVPERLALLKEAVDSGLNAYAFIGPLVPVGVEELLARVAETGVTRIMMDALHLRPGTTASVRGALAGHPLVLMAIQEALDGGYSRVLASAKEEARGLGIEVVE